MHQKSTPTTVLPLTAESSREFVRYASSRLFAKFREEYPWGQSASDMPRDLLELSWKALRFIADSELNRLEIARKIASVMDENRISSPALSRWDLERLALEAIDELEDALEVSECESLSTCGEENEHEGPVSSSAHQAR